MGKRRRGGVLASLRDGPKKKKKVKPARKILNWIGGTIAAVAMVGAIAVLGVSFYNPSLTRSAIDVEATVQEIVDDGATAIVFLEGLRLSVPLEEADRDRVEVGETIWVRYTSISLPRSVRLEAWWLPGEDPPPTGE